MLSGLILAAALAVAPVAISQQPAQGPAPKPAATQMAGRDTTKAKPHRAVRRTTARRARRDSTKARRDTTKAKP